MIKQSVCGITGCANPPNANCRWLGSESVPAQQCNLCLEHVAQLSKTLGPLLAIGRAQMWIKPPTEGTGE